MCSNTWTCIIIWNEIFTHIHQKKRTQEEKILLFSHENQRKNETWKFWERGFEFNMKIWTLFESHAQYYSHKLPHYAFLMSRDSRKNKFSSFNFPFFPPLEFQWKLLDCRFPHTHTSHRTTSWRHHIKQLTNSQTLLLLMMMLSHSDQITKKKKVSFHPHNCAYLPYQRNIVELMAIKNEIKSLMIWATIDEMASYFIISSLSLSHTLSLTHFSSSFIRNVTVLPTSFHSVGLFYFLISPLRIKRVDATGLNCWCCVIMTSFEPFLLLKDIF